MTAAVFAMIVAGFSLVAVLIGALVVQAAKRGRDAERLEQTQSNQEVALDAEKILDAPQESLGTRRANAQRRRGMRAAGARRLSDD